MSKARDANRVRVIFYPMAGSVNEQFNNLLKTLEWIQAHKPTPHEVYEWLRLEFNLKHYFAVNVYTVLFVSSGLVTVHDGVCHLTTDGQSVLATASPVILLEVFEKTFAGVAVFLEVLRDNPHIKIEKLNALWFEIVKERFPNMKNWGKRTLNNQCIHRINWLRAMGFIEAKRGFFTLSESGWRFVQEIPPESIAIQPHEISEQENQLDELTFDTFKPFDTSIDTGISLRRYFARDRAFREIVTTQYDFTCSVCDFRLEAPHGVYEAEAAHIIPKRRHGTDDPRNGLCLCRTCHWLFDEGIISVRDQDLSIIVASYLNRMTDRSAQRVLVYKGRRIRSAKSSRYAPAIEAIQWHNQNVFLG